MQEDSNLIKTQNILPEDHKYLTFLKKVFRHEFRKNGFRRLSTPYFYDTGFFKKIFGEDLDKKVYSFELEGKKISLKPHPSIGNLKAYIDEERTLELQPVYFYFMDVFYPKKNNQIKSVGYFGGDIIGEKDVIIDVQNLYIVSNILDKIGFSGEYEINLNLIGTKKEQEKYKEKLLDFFEDKKHLLTESGLKTLENNIFDIFKTQDEDERELILAAPKIEKSYKKDSKKDFQKLKEYLEILGLEYNLDPKLFGDYKFNDGVIWEIRFKDNNELIAKGAGYSELSNLMGTQKEIPGTGFIVDVFKIIDKLKQKNIKIKNKDKLDLFFVQLGDEAKKVVLPLSIKARQAGINTAVSLGTPSMKEQMLKANRSKARYIVMVGVMEAKTGVFQLREGATGKQQEIKKEDLIDFIIEKIGKDSLDFYEPSRDLIEK